MKKKLPSSKDLFSDSVVKMSPEEIKKQLRGNLINLDNFCCIRLSHALIVNKHPITINSDYKDKNGNKYIIKVSTMKTYLNDNYSNSCNKVNSLQGKSGVVQFDIGGQNDASGHIDLVLNGNMQYKDYSNLPKQPQQKGEYLKGIYIWEC